MSLPQGGSESVVDRRGLMETLDAVTVEMRQVSRGARLGIWAVSVRYSA